MQTANPPKQFNTLQTYQRQFNTLQTYQRRFNTLQTYQRRFNTLQTYQRQLNRLPIDQKPPLEAMHPQSTETVPQGRCWCLAEGNGRGGQHLKDDCEKVLSFPQRAHLLIPDQHVQPGKPYQERPSSLRILHVRFSFLLPYPSIALWSPLELQTSHSSVTRRGRHTSWQSDPSTGTRGN